MAKTTAAELVLARAKRVATEPSSWSGSQRRAIEAMLRELAAQIDALPAEPVGVVESACAFLNGRGQVVSTFDGADGLTFAQRIIATARALGWTAEPVRMYTRDEVERGVRAAIRLARAYPDDRPEHALEQAFLIADAEEPA